MHEKRLHGVADPRAVRLRVDSDVGGHLEIGARIDREEMGLKARIVSEELRFGADRAAAAAKAVS